MRVRFRASTVAMLAAWVTVVFGGVPASSSAMSSHDRASGAQASVIAVDPPPGGAADRERPAGLPDYFVSERDGTRRGADFTDLAAPRTAEPGMHEVLVVPLYYSAKPSTTADELREAIAGTDDYYNTATRGGIRFRTADVKPWSKIELTQFDIDNCNETPFLVAARKLAGTYQTDGTHHLVAYMQNLPSCWWGGLATIGTGEYESFAWINGYTSPQLWAHEFGHNLGLYHSGSIYCADGNDTVPLSDDCHQQTYADPWELMGNESRGMISAENLRRIGMLTPQSSTVANVDREVTIAPLTSASGLRDVSFTDGASTYHLEYRTAAGLDSWINTNSYTGPGGVRLTYPGGGIVVRRELPDFGQFGEQDVIDFHPDDDWYAAERHPGMEPGESYTFPSGRVRLDFLSASSAGARVRISYPRADGVFRLSGANRYEAAVSISKAHFEVGVKTLYIASGEVFTDALSGAAVAGRAGAPLLLVAKDHLPSVVRAEIHRLQPERIVVLGGPATVNDDVFNILTTWGAPVTRFSGADRYETSVAIAKANYQPGVPVAFIASGKMFPDALSAAPVAGKVGGPVLLVPGDAIPTTTAAELRRLAPQRIVVLGGTSTIDAATETALAGFTTGAVERWSGADRYEVSALTSRQSFPSGADIAYVASGLVFPDSLSGAPVAGMAPGPLLLVRTDRIPESVAAELTRLRPKAIVVLGGTASVRSVVSEQLKAFIR